MYYFLAHFPKIDFTQINKIREAYDPNSKYIDPHIAVVFPVSSEVGEENLIAHFGSILIGTSSFPITLQGLEKSWDHYLYLTVKEGKEDFISLHDKLYTGILEKYWLKSVPYSPHITLGFFADRQAMFDKSDLGSIKVDQNKFDEAKALAHRLELNYTTRVDSLHLLKRNDKTSPMEKVHEFKLI
jgi:2'-5' RNA ligase